MKTYFHRRATVSITANPEAGEPGSEVKVEPGEESNSFIITIPQGEKGDTGEPFTYADLTDAQKADLREGITLDAIGMEELTTSEITSICT